MASAARADHIPPLSYPRLVPAERINGTAIASEIRADVTVSAAALQVVDDHFESILADRIGFLP